MGDDERIAYLSGDSAVPLDPEERADLDELRSFLADEALWVEPDPGLEERIVASISAASPQAEWIPGGPRSSAPIPLAEAAARRRRLGYRVLAAAAALVLVAAVGVGVIARVGSNHPVTFEASMTGTELAAGASGRATLTRTNSGWRILLHATGLPRLDNGQYYEAWLKDARGRLVPVGTFNEPTKVTLWAGVPPSQFPTLTVTRQRTANGPASSKRVVLVGATHRDR